jgi:hypothetical protein
MTQMNYLTTNSTNIINKKQHTTARVSLRAEHEQ